MANFLVIISSVDFEDKASQLFDAALKAAGCLEFRQPSRTVRRPWACAATFARPNGSGAPLVTDVQTESWLLAIGTWFHADGYGSGAESHLLDRYLEIGAGQLGRELEGFFVLVIGDARTREVAVLTDMVGSCHSYIRSWKKMVAISNSSLLLAALEDITVDPVGCQEFLYTGVIYEHRTLYREVQKLPPATMLSFAEGALATQKPYWQITDLTPDSLEGSAAIEALSESLTTAARKIERLFPHAVCDLTGGYDSRTLVAAFWKAGVQFSTTVSGPAESPDVIVSRDLAQRAALPHCHIDPQGPQSFNHLKRALSFTDGEYDLIEYARILGVHQVLSGCFDVSLNGSFGELARGYWWELLWPHTGAHRRLNAERLARLRYAAQSYDASLFPPETRLDLVSHLRQVIDGATLRLSHVPNTLQLDYTYLTLRMQCWQGRIASSTNRLWPCLSPFLLRSVLETMLQTQSRLRRRSLLIRTMLAELYPSWAEVPLEHGHPAVPASWNNCYRFWPLALHYGKKILDKAMQGIGWRGMFPSSQTNPLQLRLRLWQEEEVQELLHPQSIRLSCLADPVALHNFLTRSQQQDFRLNAQWARLLTVEYALQLLEDVKARCATQGMAV